MINTLIEQLQASQKLLTDGGGRSPTYNFYEELINTIRTYEFMSRKVVDEISLANNNNARYYMVATHLLTEHLRTLARLFHLQDRIIWPDLARLNTLLERIDRINETYQVQLPSDGARLHPEENISRTVPAG
jgi:hypothetical protein